MNLDRYVGLPFKDLGRDRSGCDCYGLLRLVYADAGVVLPSYADDYRTAKDDAANAALIASLAEPWVEVAEAQTRALDAVLLKSSGHECHIGVVVRRGLVLHTGLHMGFSRIEPYNSIRLRKRVGRFLRHEAMA